MKKPVRMTMRIMILLLAESGLLLMAGCVSMHDSAPPPRPAYMAAELLPEMESKRVPASSEALRKFKKDGSIHLSLSDCLTIALEQNYDIRLTQEALVQADEKIVQAKSALLPFLGAEASYRRLDEPVSFALGQQSLTFIDRNISTAGVVVRQPIFMGGRLQAAHKATQYSRDAQAQENRTVEEDIIFQVTRAYRITQVAEAFQKVAEEALDLLSVHKHDVAILVEKGANPEIDLLRTRTEVADARKELNGADNAVDLACSALKNLLGISLEEPVSLTEALEQAPKTEWDLSSLTTTALSQRPELSAIDARIVAAEQALKAAKGEYLPAIAMEGRYEYMKGDFRDMEGDNHWTLGLVAEVPLWTWGKIGAKVGEATSRLAQVRIQREKTVDRIRLEVRQAFLDLGKAGKNIEAANSALITSKEAYRLSRARYVAGEGTNTDVLDARTSLSRAEANYVQALFDHNVSLAALHRAVGMVEAERLGLKEKDSNK